MTTTDPPFCVDCRHHLFRDLFPAHGGYSQVTVHHCHHPRLLKETLDVVTGQRVTTGQARCHDMRGWQGPPDDAHCGPAGDWFEAKPEADLSLMWPSLGRK